jgi:hypothetical protein
MKKDAGRIHAASYSRKQPTARSNVLISVGLFASLNMPRCPYCRRQLPGLETLCNECLAAQYEQLVRPKSWWQRRQLWHRPRFTRYSLYGFLFVFTFGILDARILCYECQTTRNAVLIACVYALIVVLIESTRRRPNANSK